MPTPSAILANNLVVTKSGQEILHQISLQVKTGSICGLIGPSGSGKSTLMRTIVGVQRYVGELDVLGQPAGSADLRRKIGYVTQAPAVYGDLTVRQNLAYFAKISGAPKADVDKILHTVQLDSYANRLSTTLSGGQKARVSLAVALLGSPEVLVLDEPTVGLDPLLRQQLWQLFRTLADEGKTLLISSHVMDEADRCDDLILMRQGHIMWNDTRQKLLAQSQTSSTGEAFLQLLTETNRA